MTSVDQSIRAAFAPTGVLRAAINYGNPILARRDPATDRPFGVSVDLAHELARRLDLPVNLVTFDGAGKSVTAIIQGDADIGFFAIDPVRGAGVAFTTPYVLIEGNYLVRNDSPIFTNDEVDKPGIRVSVGAASAYDLHLTRALSQAEIVRAPTSAAVVDTFLANNLEVAAGVKQQLEADARRLGGLRLLADHFMVIRQAMGIAKTRGEPASVWLNSFVTEMKSSPFIADALTRHRIEGASLAP
jgi:polar amino acid transport system substrate-binding protein